MPNTEDSIPLVSSRPKARMLLALARKLGFLVEVAE